MKSTTKAELKVFGTESPDLNDNQIDYQIPFLSNLAKQFERVTGWQLDFNETRASLNNRTTVDRDSTVFGQLEISDMSTMLAPGENARDRVYCNQLASTLDSMIGLIQSDRERWRTLDRCLSPVVPSPFDWWRIEGNCGFCDNRFASWAVLENETLRMFAGEHAASDSFQSALASSLALSAFETACEASLSLHEVAPLIPAVLQRSSWESSRLNWFSTLELDPITGEFELDGSNAEEGNTLIDVQANKALIIDPHDNDNILFAGQIMCVGIGGRSVIDRIDDLLHGQECSVPSCLKMIRQEFSETAAIFLYRK